MPGKLNLTIYKGETFRHTLVWKDANDAVIDLTGYTARMQVRAKIDDTSPLLTLTTENGGITITPLEGKIELYISASATAAMTWLIGVYDLELVIMVNGVEEVTRLVGGRIQTNKEVTR